MAYDDLLKRYRKKPLLTPTELEADLKPVNYERDVIERLIPHRPPLLFVDRIRGLNLRRQVIWGSRYMDPGDPVFAGHFPDHPIYPGNFEIEMIGQLALCLYHFVGRNSIRPAEKPEPLQVRATRVGGAYFQEPVTPDQSVDILAQVIDSDDYLASAVGQVLVAGSVSCVAVGEVVFLS